MFYSYILRSEKDHKYYYGSAKDIHKRLEMHNKGKVRSTKSRRPFKLHFYEIFETKSKAMKREYFYKSISGYNWLRENNIIEK